MPSKALATQLPTFGALKKFETRMACKTGCLLHPLEIVSVRRKGNPECFKGSVIYQLLANTIQIGIKYLIFQKIIFSS